MRIFTIGHSNHSLEHFQGLVRDFQIEVLVDVRSWPHSRFVEWVDRSNMADAIRPAGARYLFLGDQLGGRPEGNEFYDPDGYVLYSRVAESDFFRAGIGRLLKGAQQFRVAVMCSEEDPAGCHRRLLVTKVLLERGFTVAHIRGDGSCEVESEPIGLSEGKLFEDEGDLWRSSLSVSRARAPRTSSAA